MSKRGFTLIELLVAVAVVLVVAGLTASLAVPMRHGFDRSAGVGDVTRTARAGLMALAAAARDAGAGVVIGPAPRSIGDLIPVVVPFRSLDDSTRAEPFGAVTFVRATGPQGLLRDPIADGDTVIRLDPNAPCAGGEMACGFHVGDAAVLFDRSSAESVVIDDINVGPGELRLAAPVSRNIEGGAVIAAIERITYGLRAASHGSRTLVRITAGGAEQPVIDHAIELEISLWIVTGASGSPVRIGGWISDGDLLGACRIDVRLRVEAASADLRGPAGPLFRTPGTAAHSARWVPDIELHASVALRR